MTFNGHVFEINDPVTFFLPILTGGRPTGGFKPSAGRHVQVNFFGAANGQDALPAAFATTAGDGSWSVTPSAQQAGAAQVSFNVDNVFRIELDDTADAAARELDFFVLSMAPQATVGITAGQISSAVGKLGLPSNTTIAASSSGLSFSGSQGACWGEVDIHFSVNFVPDLSFDLGAFLGLTLGQYSIQSGPIATDAGHSADDILKQLRSGISSAGPAADTIVTQQMPGIIQNQFPVLTSQQVQTLLAATSLTFSSFSFLNQHTWSVDKTNDSTVVVSPAVNVGYPRDLSQAVFNVVVPNVVGMSQASVDGFLSSQGLAGAFDGQYVLAQTGGGNVAAQDPAPGAVVAEGSAVQYSVTLARPVVSFLQPSSGSTLGGNVQIEGSNFAEGATVDFGGKPGTGVFVPYGGEFITVTAPPHAAGQVHVTVQNPPPSLTPAPSATDLTSTTSSADLYTYVYLPGVATITLSSNVLWSGETGTGTITLNEPAAPGGTSVTLSVGGSTDVSVHPSPALVGAGQTSTTFSISTPVGGDIGVLIGATGPDGKTVYATQLTVYAGQIGLAATDGEFSAAGYATCTGTVFLRTPAPVSGANVSLSSTGPATGVPAAVTVPSGQTSATFTLTVKGPVTVTATYGGSSATATFDGTPRQVPVPVSGSGSGSGSGTGSTTHTQM